MLTRNERILIEAIRKAPSVTIYAGDYEVLPELEERHRDRFTLRKNGRWYMEGQETSPNSVVLMLHYQEHYIDPSF